MVDGDIFNDKVGHGPVPSRRQRLIMDTQYQEGIQKLVESYNYWTEFLKCQEKELVEYEASGNTEGAASRKLTISIVQNLLANLKIVIINACDAYKFPKTDPKVAHILS